MTGEDLKGMPLAERVRRIKVHTPGDYELHAWVDKHRNNGAVIDSVLLTVANGGKRVSGVPE
jgi:hypothetical protein